MTLHPVLRGWVQGCFVAGAVGGLALAITLTFEWDWWRAAADGVLIVTAFVARAVLSREANGHPETSA